jgi:hypothetical protein
VTRRAWAASAYIHRMDPEATVPASAPDPAPRVAGPAAEAPRAPSTEALTALEAELAALEAELAALEADDGGDA